jgi:EAL domain-containing protein (putative c-di-GMP-specific phosphodiesterase class I)
MRDREDLVARAALEKKLGPLGRAIRTIATRECPHTALYLAVHPSELREGLIVQPDDPVFSHAAPLRLQLSQPGLPAVAQAVLRELSGRSTVELVIDDFGAGAGTLKQWVDLSPRAVKIDAELIAGIDRSRRKQSAVRALVGLARELGSELIAKGVDCPDEARAVLDCGVRLGQGFALGEPSPLPAISIWPKR